MSFYKFIFFVSVCLPATVWAAHPLVTDDAGTQGKGNFSFEVNGQYDHDKQSGVTSTGGQTAAALTYGVTDTIDLAVGIPYLWIKEDPDQSSPWENGFSDATVDVKLRLFEKDGLSFAIKPGLSFPTGDDDTGLGAGKIGYRFYMIGMKEPGENAGSQLNQRHFSLCATPSLLLPVKTPLSGSKGVGGSVGMPSTANPNPILISALWTPSVLPR
jgi:hypothetical protein